jgi:hypothetical protein
VLRPLKTIKRVPKLKVKLQYLFKPVFLGNVAYSVLFSSFHYIFRAEVLPIRLILSAFINIYIGSSM